MRKAIVLLVLAALLTSEALAPATADPRASRSASLDRSVGRSTLPLGHRGRWITDAKGRVVILHGVNMVAKLPPYKPAALGFDEDDAAFLAKRGFNTVRLGIIFKGLEPELGSFDDAYLDSIARTARILGRHGIYVLVDFHQDMYNERFNGEGFPDWMVQDDGLPPEPDGGFPANYFIMPALWRAYDHFWADGSVAEDVTMQDAFAQAWRYAAERLRDVRAVVGYDTFNEPWPGSDWEACLQPEGCPLFDAELTQFYTRVFNEIRKADSKRLVFYEPHPQMAGTGADVYIDDTGDPRAGFSFHFYCLDALGWPGEFGTERCPIGENRPFEVADEVSKRNGDALIMSEFGASDDLKNLQLNLDLLDRHRMSWQYWSYWNEDPCCERPHEGIIKDPSKPPRGDNVKRRKVRVLVRPYPRAVAGTPLKFRFFHGRKRRNFKLVYTANPAIDAPTVIFVPARQYPRGYRVKVSGPARVVSKRGASLLRVRSVGAGKVRVVVLRSGKSLR